jgi:hypothetical protein
MLGLRITLTILALASCGKGEVAFEAVPIDAMPVKAVEAYRPLTGTWSGSMNIKALGIVTGLVSIDPSGNGTFFVSATGASRSGSIEILEFANGQVRARALGQERSVAITVVGENELRLQIVGVGELVLSRSDS